MTDEDWMGDDSFEMCEHLEETLRRDAENSLAGFDRKLRLAGVACCRRMSHLFVDATQDVILHVVEKYADKTVSLDELMAASNETWEIRQAHEQATAGANWQPIDGARGMICHAIWGIAEPQDSFDLRYVIEKLYGATVNDPDDPEEEEKHQAVIIRDIFGNPFRPVKFDACWRTSTAIGLAQTMYDARDFSAMPILADALEDAGCEDAAILSHCRDPHGVHVRGCWVVDLVLGKA